jgi:hypothetical protein
MNILLLEGWRKTTKTSASVIELAEIRTLDLQNKTQKCQPLNRDVISVIYRYLHIHKFRIHNASLVSPFKLKWPQPPPPEVKSIFRS